MSDPTGPVEDPPLGDPEPVSPPTTPAPEHEPGQTPTELPQPDLPTSPGDDRPYGAASSIA
jgi:hypothetical protein